MRIEQRIISDCQPAYPIGRLANPKQILYIDIETTGFTAKHSSLYLIGAAYYADGAYHLTQWFADAHDDEKNLLKAFFTFAADFSLLVHFNGDQFDLPYILQKCEQHHLLYDFSHLQSLDLYKKITPYKLFLNIPNCKQRTLEQFLGIHRMDPYNGGELINAYHAYRKTPSEDILAPILQHNADDVAGLILLTSLLAYDDLFHEPFQITKVQANTYPDLQGNEKQEFLMKLQLPTPLPKPVSALARGCYFTGEGTEGILKVPIYREEMKFFYPNPKEYYYLPMEDNAIHKSVSSYVDKAHRQQATAATCYTRKASSYLQQWETIAEPIFKRDYKSKECFFELTETRKKDRALFARYASHILHQMVNPTL